MPTNNIIVLDSYYNLTNKSNLIDRLYYDLIRFFDNLIVAYFFGPPFMNFLNTSRPLFDIFSDTFTFHY